MPGGRGLHRVVCIRIRIGGHKTQGSSDESINSIQIDDMVRVMRHF